MSTYIYTNVVKYPSDKREYEFMCKEIPDTKIERNNGIVQAVYQK